MISQFKDEFSFLSNFFIEDDGITVEHLFQADKTLDKQWKEKILSASTPGKAKRLGRKVPIKEDWENIKLSVMLKHLRKKFSSKKLSTALINTYPHVLIEGNKWHDNIWGNCTCIKCIEIEGKNFLGKLLMKVRKELMDKDI